MKYVELECVDDYFDEVKVDTVKVEMEVRNITAKPRKKKIRSRSIWDDSEYEVEIYYLNDILGELAAAGWEYKCTYWMGGSSGDAHKVFCFLHQ